MRNKCLFALGVVFAMSLTSIVAFAFSFTGELEAKNDLRQIIAVDSVAESEEPTTEQTTVPAESEETTATLQPSDSSLLGSIDWDVEDAYMLAKIAMAEAESEDTEGKALVMLVVLNRVWSDEFPDTIAGVILQDGQFSPISNGRYDEVEPDADCYRALQLIQIDGWDESRGATYFESKSESNWHSEHLTFLFQHDVVYPHMPSDENMLAGTYPTDTTKGMVLENGVNIRTSSSDMVYGHLPSSEEQEAGTYPENTTVGISYEDKITISTNESSALIAYEQCGTNPDIATLGQQSENKVSFGTSESSAVLTYVECGTNLCGEEGL